MEVNAVLSQIRAMQSQIRGTSDAFGATGGALATGSAAAPSSVTLFDQGLLQVLQVSATGLQPRQPYLLALADQPDGSGTLQPLASFMTNPAGSAIVNAIGPIRQIVEVKASTMRRYLVIASGSAAHPGAIVQVQVP